MRVAILTRLHAGLAADTAQVVDEEADQLTDSACGRVERRGVTGRRSFRHAHRADLNSESSTPDRARIVLLFADRSGSRWCGTNTVSGGSIVFHALERPGAPAAFGPNRSRRRPRRAGGQARMHLAVWLRITIDGSAPMRRVCVPEGNATSAARRQHDGVVLVRLFGGGLPLDGLEMALPSGARTGRLHAARGAGMVERRTRPEHQLTIDAIPGDAGVVEIPPFDAVLKSRRFHASSRGGTVPAPSQRAQVGDDASPLRRPAAVSRPAMVDDAASTLSSCLRLPHERSGKDDVGVSRRLGQEKIDDREKFRPNPLRG